MARRDPEGRRRAIVNAAVEVIAQVGVARTTHRAIAEQAGVPLGSTTYYFPTLADLVAEAVTEVARLWEADLRAWGQALTSSTDVARTLTGLAESFVADRQRARRDYELYVLAGREMALRPAARTWVEGLRALLTPLAGASKAASLTELVDGAMLTAVVTGEPLQARRLTRAFRALLAS